MQKQRNKSQRRLNLYLPSLGAGSRIKPISDDLRTIEVEMPLRFFNRNYVGTHFGGSLYAMCDPFFMLILINNLGPDYIVWDKAATIRFKKPGTGLVKAGFHRPEERIEEISSHVQVHGKVEPQFQALVKDTDGHVIAEVGQLLYRKKKETT